MSYCLHCGKEFEYNETTETERGPACTTCLRILEDGNEDEVLCCCCFHFFGWDDTVFNPSQGHKCFPCYEKPYIEDQKQNEDVSTYKDYPILHRHY